MLDIMASNYGCLPSDLLKLDWNDLIFNFACLKTKGERFEKAMRQNKRKKGMIFPNLSIMDLVNCPG